MQVAAMFLGEALALALYFLLRWKDPEGHRQRQEQAVLEGKHLEFNKFKIAIPALCDSFGSMLQLFALNFTAGSIYQMMRGGTIITTFVFSIILLKMRPRKYQMVGSLLAFVGIAVVGTAAMVFSDPEGVSADPVLLN
jgi:drug/metabolite transporter (DMT)-like permease